MEQQILQGKLEMDRTLTGQDNTLKLARQQFLMLRLPFQCGFSTALMLGLSLMLQTMQTLRMVNSFLQDQIT